MGSWSANDAFLEGSDAQGAPAGRIPTDLVTADVEDLIVGRALRYPLYDPNGLLLLAEGLTLTEEFKRTLEGRNLRVVQLHQEDYERLTSRAAQTPRDSKFQLDEEIARKLDEIVDDGLLFVVNSEAALLDQITRHGTENYDRRKYLERISRNKETSATVDNLIRNAVRGKSIDCGEVSHLAASYLGDITGDLDGTLASRVDTIRYSPVSDHCVAMAVLGMAMGVELGFDARNVRTIAVAGLLHDWGMARVPQEIREATRRLTEEEYFEIMKHPIYTLEMLDRMCGLPALVPLVCYQVHERPNGEGYPRGRDGERIHPIAKILAVADAYNALISPRPYRPPLIPYAAMECLLRQASCGDYDPQVVQALLMVQSLFPIGSHVVLSDGSSARVLRRNGRNYRQPIVRLVQDADGKEVPENSRESIIDLGAANLEIVKTLASPGTQAIGLSPKILELGRRRAGQLDPPSARPGIPADAGSREVAELAGSLDQGPMADTEVISVECYTEKQNRLARHVLDLLDGSGVLTDRQHARSRSHPRMAARTVVTICLVSATSADLSVPPGGTFRAYTRDVSQKGMCFIHPGPLPTDQVLVGLPVCEGEQKWFLGRIVRRREIGDTTFWEYGLALQQRVPV